MKEICYQDLSKYYRVHHNTIRKVVARWKCGDFSIHKSTTKKNLSYRFKYYAQREKQIIKRITRESVIVRYEKDLAW